MTAQDAIGHISALFPPDSQYEETAEIGKRLMDDTVGNATGHKNWRNLTDDQLIKLAKANLREAGETEF